MIRTSLINPPPADGVRYIREGRCMQSTDSSSAIWPPVGLATLASIASKFGEVQFIDGNVINASAKQIIQTVAKFAPDIVVVNSGFPSIEWDNTFAKLVKESQPKTIIIGFGVFFTLLENESLRECLGFDVACIGEPEITFSEFLEHYEKNRCIPEIAGLIWRNSEEIKSGPPRPFLMNLDQLPFPARDLIENDKYTLPFNNKPFTVLNIARGCPFKCTFCIAPIYDGPFLRCHSIDYVIEEIRECVQRYKLHHFLFWEEIFTLDKEYAVKLCENIIKKNLKIEWSTTTRPDTLDFDTLRIMKSSGCILLALGIESSSQEILDSARKGTRVEKIHHGVQLARKAGIPTMGNVIFGLPGESKETALSTINYVCRLGLDYLQCYCAVPYPKTPLREIAKEKRLIQNQPWCNYNFGGKSIMDTEYLTAEQVTQFRDLAFRRFYLRPAKLLKIVSKFRTPQNIIRAWRFTKWMQTN